MLFIWLEAALGCISTPKWILKANNMLLMITAKLIRLPAFNFQSIPIISFLALDCNAGWDLVPGWSAKGNTAEVPEKV